MEDLKGRSAVVTGANRGIVKAIVRKLAASGCNIWACARQKYDGFEEELSSVSQESGVEITPVYFDISDEDAIKEGFKQIYKSRKPIDILVNAAGVVNTDIFQMTPMKKLHEVFAVNFFGAVCLTQLVLKVMQRSGGSIINIASIAGLDTNPTNCTYGSSKAALIHFSKVLASEVSRYGIRVNAVAPGPADTDMVKTVKEAVGEEHLLERCAMERLAAPEEIANVVAFLASDSSSFVNGQVIRIDGGAR